MVWYILGSRFMDITQVKQTILKLNGSRSAHLNSIFEHICKSHIIHNQCIIEYIQYDSNTNKMHTTEILLHTNSVGPPWGPSSGR